MSRDDRPRRSLRPRRRRRVVGAALPGRGPPGRPPAAARCGPVRLAPGGSRRRCRSRSAPPRSERTRRDGSAPEARRSRCPNRQPVRRPFRRRVTAAGHLRESSRPDPRPLLVRQARRCPRSPRRSRPAASRPTGSRPPHRRGPRRPAVPRRCPPVAARREPRMRATGQSPPARDEARRIASPTVRVRAELRGSRAAAARRPRGQAATRSRNTRMRCAPGWVGPAAAPGPAALAARRRVGGRAPPAPANGTWTGCPAGRRWSPRPPRGCADQ